ncbi:MAG: hypothetical protein WC869_03160 [Phycisphaerae bacterium]|jgi:hypothetical protein
MNDNDRKDLPTDREEEAPDEAVGTPNALQNAVRKLADKRPEKLIEVMAMEMSSVGNPLHHKMNEEHISKVLELAAKHDERQYDLHKKSQENAHSEGNSNRRYCFAAFLVVATITSIVLFLFKDKPDVLVPILTGLGGLVSGFLGGWGLGRKHD